THTTHMLICTSHAYIHKAHVFSAYSAFNLPSPLFSPLLSSLPPSLLLCPHSFSALVPEAQTECVCVCVRECVCSVCVCGVCVCVNVCVLKSARVKCVLGAVGECVCVCVCVCQSHCSCVYIYFVNLLSVI